MRRFWPVALILAAWLGCPSQLPAQIRAAPVYALPADGTWVDYDWESSASGAGGSGQAGTLRISSVGTTTVQGRAHRWVEITKEVRTGNGQGNRVKRQSRRLLVDEQALAAGRPLTEAVERVDDTASDGSITHLSRDRLRVFTGLGIQGVREELREVSTPEEVSTALGRFRTRHVTAKGSTAGRVLEYHGWLSPDVPFGWARMEIRRPAGPGPSWLVFRATAARNGRAATSEGNPSGAR
jgi:hypothetical protein